MLSQKKNGIFFFPLTSTYAVRCLRTYRKFIKCLVSSYSSRVIVKQYCIPVPRLAREQRAESLKSLTRQTHMKRGDDDGDIVPTSHNFQDSAQNSVHIPFLPQTISWTSKLFVQSYDRSLDPNFTLN